MRKIHGGYSQTLLLLPSRGDHGVGRPKDVSYSVHMQLQNELDLRGYLALNKMFDT